MFPTNQPLPTTNLVPVAEVPLRSEVARLLHAWADLARSAAAREAHSRVDDGSLRRRQVLVEEAILDHVPDAQPALDELIAWESTFIHVAPGVPVATCLFCRRARRNPPLLEALGASR
ncbi:hypothetical protein GCM10022197_22050 [Microlunatus spumicola]|uniref:Uncharacterized protein n=1 Tax=Microlunatus spumicola TaxID=81499 RepID=A0ABP6XIF0_9ACTN